MSLSKFANLVEANSYMDVTTIIAYLSVTLLLTTGIFIIYRLTYTGVAYSNNFNVSIVLTGLITSMIMMVIGNNLALSLGMVGALSIVRFRAAIKEPKDISYLFWAIAVGLAAGTGALQIALVGRRFVGLVIVIYHLIPNNPKSYLLIVKGENCDASLIRETLGQHVKKYSLRVKNLRNEKLEMIFEVRIGKSEEALIKSMKAIKDVHQVNLVEFSGYLNE